MAENDAEPKAGGGLVKKLLIFGGGGLLLIAIGLGAGFLIFGGAQPDPSEEIEEIIERKMQEREAAEEEEADNSTPQKMSRTRLKKKCSRPSTTNFQVPLPPTWRARARAAGRRRCFYPIR